MIENLAGAEIGSGAVRRPYVKPFVRNLDVLDTEGKSTAPSEFGGSGSAQEGPS
jgi:hypothetical protein